MIEICDVKIKTYVMTSSMPSELL